MTRAARFGGVGTGSTSIDDRVAALCGGIQLYRP
ncbi:hypothetical protein ABIA39_006460 [Nocardia sp. GAS34]|jgi:hypothetical protein